MSPDAYKMIVEYSFFNVKFGASMGKPRNDKGKVLIMFSKHIGVCDSNEAEVLAILEAIHLFSSYCIEALIMKSDSSNAISWVSKRKVLPWKFQFIFNEIRGLSSSINVVFSHEVRSANSMADSLAK